MRTLVTSVYTSRSASYQRITIKQHKPKLPELHPSLARQGFYDGDILQQIQRSIVTIH